MRLSAQHVAAIKRLAAEQFGAGVQVRLFGSRVDDTARGGVRFLLIIFKIATLYSPLKLFLPASALFFVLGLINYLHTYIDYGRLTNMSALQWSAPVIV